MAVLGVDISENNSSVNFDALQKAGVEFVLIRCGYGSDYPNQDDSSFLENVRKAKEAGMAYGVYLYSYAMKSSQAKSEAAHVIRLLGEVERPAYGVWFDMEDADHYKANRGMPGNDTLVQICDTFCREIEAAGYYTGIYASLSWMENQLKDPRLDRYDKWVAQWNTTCDYSGDYGIWQFTDCLEIAGNTFDGNWAYKDYPVLTAQKRGTDLTEAEIREIVREEFSRYLTGLANKPVSTWAQKAVEYCKGNGLMVGDKNGDFRPQSFMTRQEIAQVLMNLHSTPAR